MTTEIQDPVKYPNLPTVSLYCGTMSVILNRLKHLYIFFVGYFFVAVTAAIYLYVKGKAGSFLQLNSYHYQWLDDFFIGFTNLGDGVFAILVSVFCFFGIKKRKLGLLVLIAYAFTGITAQLIKPIMESPRPETYFAPLHLPFFIDDIINNGNNSFPSGHTVTAFALATVLVFYAANKWYQLLLLLIAMLVGYSRIYLSQHFLTDVLGGSLLGVLGALLCVYWCRNLTDEKLLFTKKQ